MASLASAVTGARSARGAGARQSDSAQSRSYTSGAIAMLDLQAGFPINPPPGSKKGDKGPHMRSSGSGGGGGGGGGGGSSGPLKVLSAAPSLAKQDEMAKWLEQRLLQTRF